MRHLSRDSSIDRLRGLAILLMVPANMGLMLPSPHPLWFRFFSSLAAPTFLILVGMMVGKTSSQRSLGHFLARGLLTLVLAAFLDIVAWGLLPFTTMDILYFIGFSLPLCYLLRRLSVRSLGLLTLVFFGFALFLQSWIGYTTYPTEYNLLGELKVSVPQQTSILHHWFVDGWFPFFPWFGFLTFGLALARLRWPNSSLPQAFQPLTKTVLWWASCLVLGGGILWYLYPGAMLEREGYSELFYPPTLGFLLTMPGIFVWLLFALDQNAHRRPLQWLEMYGQHAMLVYLVHVLLIARVLYPLFSSTTWPMFVALWMLLFITLGGCAWAAPYLRKQIPRPTLLTRMILGG